uniref:G_PROTEIN_RECEP_F1_2 domain-containing protein n=1 Tax=Meloidogyne hapla TaxID=6305 RepID=A0A1I8B552_MELHA
MWTYLWFHLLCTVTCVAYPISEFLRWKTLDETIRTFDVRSPDEQIVLFWTGIWQLNYYACAPIVTFFLMLDRCFVLWFSVFRNAWTEKLIKWMSVCCLTLFYCTSMAFYLNELPLNRSTKKSYGQIRNLYGNSLRGHTWISGNFSESGRFLRHPH